LTIFHQNGTTGSFVSSFWSTNEEPQGVLDAFDADEFSEDEVESTPLSLSYAGVD
jgi:hypothetical protein